MNFISDETYLNQSKEFNLEMELNQFDLKFDVTLAQHEKLKGAELRLYRHSIYEIISNNKWLKNTLNDSLDESQLLPNSYDRRIKIYRRSDPKSDKSLILIDSQTIDIKYSGWLSFDIYSAVHWWLQYPNENYGLVVKITIKNQSNSSNTSTIDFSSPIWNSQLFVFHPEYFPWHSTFAGESNHIDIWDELQPIILTYSVNQYLVSPLMKENLIRTKRDAADYREQLIRNNNETAREKFRETNNSTDLYCKRYPLSVDLKRIDFMKFLIEPEVYEAYYCDGNCFPMINLANNHALLQAFMSRSKPNEIPEPCCVPTKLSPLTIIFMKEDKIVLENRPEMVVEECDCL